MGVRCDHRLERFSEPYLTLALVVGSGDGDPALGFETRFIGDDLHVTLLGRSYPSWRRIHSIAGPPRRGVLRGS